MQHWRAFFLLRFHIVVVNRSWSSSFPCQIKRAEQWKKAKTNKRGKKEEEAEERRARVYIFKKPPVTILPSNVKRSPKIAPINYAYLAAWERKCPRSPKTWECVTKTKQANKLGPARSSGGLEMQRVPAEGQKCDASCPTWESFLWDTSGPECPRRWLLGVTAVGAVSLRN